MRDAVVGYSLPDYNTLCYLPHVKEFGAEDLLQHLAVLRAN